MKSGQKILIGIVIVVLVLGMWFFSTKNSLVALNEDVKLQYSQIETTLQRRCELIPSLVETVKGYAKHEEKIFTEIAEARSNLLSSIESGNLENIDSASKSFDSAVTKLLAISENYPELEASALFISLQDELAGTANRINVARQHYNEKVNSYNRAVQSFPTSIVASMSGYYPMDYFEADSGAHKVPEVNFD